MVAFHPHLRIRLNPAAEQYSPHGRGSSAIKLPPRDREQHGSALQQQFQAAINEGVARRQGPSALGIGVADGLYIQFKSSPDFELALDRLQLAKHGIEVLSVISREGAQWSTVFVPDGKTGVFLKRFEEYLSRTTPKGHPRHQNLVDSIAEIRLAALQSLWTDDPTQYPSDPEAQIWWEVWLRDTGNDEYERFQAFANVIHAELRADKLRFLDRYVLLVHTSANQLSSSLDTLNDIAEVRLAKVAAGALLQIPITNQTNTAESVANRLQPAASDAPAVCVLDTGVNRAHILLQSSLDQNDMHAADPTWGSEDNHGHGTEMAGLALLGDIAQLPEGIESIPLTHRLESVKIFRPEAQEQPPPELYGALTANAAGRVELQEPGRERCFCLAVTTSDYRDRGQPSSWSAEIDSLSSGAGEEDPKPKRLFFVAVGNKALPSSANYFDESLTAGAHDPSQSWNAISVGAFTERFEINDPDFEGWKPLAPPGDLSPTSSTSVVWEPRWPIKPDLVMEGGNAAISAHNHVDFAESLSLVTTYHLSHVRQFTATGETSAAVSLAARLGAMIQARYPNLWPETVRALIINSCAWTDAMLARVPQDASRRARETLVRCYGFGRPDARLALESASNAVTLIAQSTIQPYEKNRMKEMHLHSLPWPRDLLLELGDADVSLKVTLSYFIEPNPARRGWKRPHRYASHGLRFDVKGATETVSEFRKRLNRMALAEEEEKPVSHSSGDWFLGPRVRNRGSLHSDIWRGSAAELAERGAIGIYPVVGWWRERSNLERWKESVRYSLVVSIAAPRVDVDIYQPISALIEQTVAVET
jgi:hypothetical protein